MTRDIKKLQAEQAAIPPRARSRTALTMSAAAAEGRFVLQSCKDCGRTTYPPRDVCPNCWSSQLEWRDADTGGELLAETTLHASTNAFFQQHLPWRIGLVQLDCGPQVLAHLHSDVQHGSRVSMRACLDRSGQGVLVALPDSDAASVADDRQLRILTCDTRGSSD